MKIDIKWFGPTLKDVEIVAEVFGGNMHFVITHDTIHGKLQFREKTVEEVISAYVKYIDDAYGRIYHITDGIDPNGIFNLTLIESSAMGQETYTHPPRSVDDAIAEYRKLYLSILRLTPDQVQRAEDMLSLRVFHRKYLRHCEKCNYPHYHNVQNSPTTCQPDCATVAKKHFAPIDPKYLPSALINSMGP
jgi:hypothetical protein